LEGRMLMFGDQGLIGSWIWSLWNGVWMS